MKTKSLVIAIILIVLVIGVLIYLSSSKAATTQTETQQGGNTTGLVNFFDDIKNLFKKKQPVCEKPVGFSGPWQNKDGSFC